MINSDLTDFVAEHYFRMFSLVQIEKEDLHGMSAITTAVLAQGKQMLFIHRFWG